MPTDEELVGRVADGEERALAELLRRYQHPLCAFLTRQTNGRDVEDLYQETWIRVLRSADRFDHTKRFSTWLFQIAINLCRDWHRRPPPEPRSAAEDTVGQADLGQTEAGLDAASLLARLPETHREVIVLRYYHDLSEDEMALMLDCPKGTVKSRLHHGLARLGALVRRKTP